MPGQSGYLQQWLNALKEKAETERGGGRSAPQSSARPAPAPRPVQVQRPVQSARPVQPVRAQQPQQKNAAASLMGILQEALDAPSQAELQRKAEAAAQQQKELRRKQALRQKRAQAQKRKQAEKQARLRAQEAKRKQEELLAKQRKSRPTSSALGLSGNLIRDLRHNPQALREAVLLVEILAPPLVDRDPFERLV